MVLGIDPNTNFVYSLTYLNVCIETPIYERLENFCKDAGHTKTVAVERALISYFDEYEEMKKKLKELESNQDK